MHNEHPSCATMRTIKCHKYFESIKSYVNKSTLNKVNSSLHAKLYKQHKMCTWLIRKNIRMKGMHIGFKGVSDGDASCVTLRSLCSFTTVVSYPRQIWQRSIKICLQCRLPVILYATLYDLYQKTRFYRAKHTFSINDLSLHEKHNYNIVRQVYVVPDFDIVIYGKHTSI